VFTRSSLSLETSRHARVQVLAPHLFYSKY
jgi:hypothetical protein